MANRELCSDAVILGGALTGTVLYIALAEIFAKHNKSLVILERESRPIPDSRMLSLGYAGGTLLKNFGVWDELEKHLCPVTSLHMLPLSNMSDSDAGSNKRGLKLEADDLGLPVLGWTVPHRQLQDVLWDRVRQLQKQHSNLTEQVPFNMESIALEGDAAVIQAGGQTISSNLVFAATGTAPLPWTGMNGGSAGRINYDYYDDKDKSAEEKPAFVVAEVKLNPRNVSHSHTGGYWFGGDASGRSKDEPTAVALTPSAKGLYNSAKARSIKGGDIKAGDMQGGDMKEEGIKDGDIKEEGIYVAIASFPSKPKHINREELSVTLQNIIEEEFSIESITEEPVIYQASSYVATDRVLGPVVLIGNAAHSVAPLGGQNYNLTLWTLSKLRNIIAQHLAAGEDFGNRSFLLDYVTETDPEIKRSLGLVHRVDDWVTGGDASNKSPLHSLFTSVLPPDAMFGHFMQTMQNVPAIRNKVFARAAGLHRLS